MPLRAIYEWDYETIDEFGDVLDHNHADKLSSYEPSEITNDLVLVRDTVDELDIIKDREWAYVKDGKLPEFFKDAMGNNGARVPKRFHKELAKYLSKIIVCPNF